ncbi:hypothetical protein LCGC14_1802110 [marine sediment metagenome]|uniref:site-specific DNA-methyltransferase (cytosine-N(4)-specific) n=1 Tax=marine sediment metagenome TaxID=412755 RepID=A0A0F9GPD0_9ZZZZ
MKPYYQDEWVTIYHGDCREILPQLPDKSADIGITSPPFNLGNTHHTGNIRHKAYEDDIPERDYQTGQTVILDRLYNTINDNGSLWYQHKNRIRDGLSISPYQWIFNSAWLIKQEIVWRNRSQNFDKIRFYPMTERLYWLVKKADTKLTNVINKHDDWHIEPVGSQGEHTRAFPEEIVNNILLCFPCAVNILDPFLGSGTTAYCAKKLNRKCIGIEIEEKYCEIAAKRCSQSVMELKI